MSWVENLLELGSALAVRAAKLKRVFLPPKLEGPKHEYPAMPPNPEDDWPTLGISFYALHVCTKCGRFSETRAAYSVPPCPGRPPSVVVELP